MLPIDVPPLVRLLDREAPERCDNFRFAASVALPYGNPRQIFMAINKTAGFPFFSDVQVSLSWLRQVAPAPVMGAIYQRELRVGEGCPGEMATESARIKLDSQAGVFLVFGICFGLGLLAAVYETRKARQPSPDEETTDGEGKEKESVLVTDGDILREILRMMRAEKAAKSSGSGTQADALRALVKDVSALKNVGSEPGGVVDQAAAGATAGTSSASKFAKALVKPGVPATAPAAALAAKAALKPPSESALTAPPPAAALSA